MINGETIFKEKIFSKNILLHSLLFVIYNFPIVHCLSVGERIMGKDFENCDRCAVHNIK